MDDIDLNALFPEDFVSPGGEAGKSYAIRRSSGFFSKYCNGETVLDVGYSGYQNPDKKAFFPNAIGVDLDYPGYDGMRLPFATNSVDTVFSSHCLEHITFYHAVIQDWHRVLNVGGFIVCIVPNQFLYEKRRFLPSRFNSDHKRFYTPAKLLAEFEESLEPNSYRIRHLVENDREYDYALGPRQHASGCYEIELVLEKITVPKWSLD